MLCVQRRIKREQAGRVGWISRLIPVPPTLPASWPDRSREFWEKFMCGGGFELAPYQDGPSLKF